MEIERQPVGGARARGAEGGDAALLAAIQRDEPGAFDSFVERYGRRLYAFGIRMCGHQEDGEDVFQDTLLRAYQRLRQLRDPAALKTWLFRVAANQCRMRRRRVGPSRELSLEQLKPPGLDEGEPVEIADWSQLPDDEAARGELKRAIEAAIRELPPDYRMVLLLRDIEGLSTRETAQALEIGSGAVKMRLHRARLALRQQLAAFHGGDGWDGGEAGGRAAGGRVAGGGR